MSLNKRRGDKKNKKVMTNDELNHFLDPIGRDEADQQVIETSVERVVAALEELQRVSQATRHRIENEFNKQLEGK